jgi:hypothetical protein
MAAEFLDTPVAEHHDQVGHPDSGEAMRYQYRHRTGMPGNTAGMRGIMLEQLMLATGSRTAVGSSSTSRRGVSRISARPTASFCHCPPESSAPAV